MMGIEDFVQIEVVLKYIGVFFISFQYVGYVVRFSWFRFVCREDCFNEFYMLVGLLWIRYYNDFYVFDLDDYKVFYFFMCQLCLYDFV